MLYRIIVAALLLALPQQAFAWSKEADETIALIAAKSLSAKSEGKVKALLALGHEESLATAASWADRILSTPSGKGTENWHMTAIPLDAKSYDKARDCARDDCAVEQVGRWAGRLRGGSQAEQVFALKFLTNLVGAVHEPVRNAAGNGARAVKFDGNATTLLAVWDRELIVKIYGTSDSAQIAAAVLKDKALGDPAKLQAGTPAEWATDSHLKAAKFAYGPLSGPEPQAINPAYIDAARPVIQEQLLKAGLRLARLLNEALDYDPPSDDEEASQGVLGK